MKSFKKKKSLLLLVKRKRLLLREMRFYFPAKGNSTNLQVYASFLGASILKTYSWRSLLMSLLSLNSIHLHLQSNSVNRSLKHFLMIKMRCTNVRWKYSKVFVSLLLLNLQLNLSSETKWRSMSTAAMSWVLNLLNKARKIWISFIRATEWSVCRKFLLKSWKIKMISTLTLNNARRQVWSELKSASIN